MKSMVVLIDTNVLINFITKRDDPYLKSSIELIKLCATEKVKGFYAVHSLSIIWYLLRKWTDSERRKALKELCVFLNVAVPDDSQIIDAIRQESFADFEDCLQSKCAESVNAAYIVTCNEKDFKESKIKAVNPDKFLELLEYS